ncbi:hypothetical protein L596_020889 [Steinernema carpocapsae]|uniref:Uncharacterized protein n=1 Tax=Steinernema carpocapsae TaxID=34508 RepID=A0A4U5MVH8_STECR|nr:hypothetical protein L596_020889 [Steinernema carpocapsae]
MAAIQSIRQDVRTHVDRRIDAVERKATAPSLKSTSLNVQNQLLETWISRLEEISETCSHPHLDLMKAEMRARAQILKKGDAEPTFFRFFDDLRAAKPECQLADITTEALQKFAELQASGNRPALPRRDLLERGPFEEAVLAIPAPPPRTSTGTKLDSCRNRSSSFSNSSCWDRGLNRLQDALCRALAPSNVSTVAVSATSSAIAPRTPSSVRNQNPLLVCCLNHWSFGSNWRLRNGS